MKQIALLEAIQAQGSISGAARALRLSYAGARLLIEGIHKILCEPGRQRPGRGSQRWRDHTDSGRNATYFLYRAIEACAQVVALAQREALDGLARTEETNR